MHHSKRRWRSCLSKRRYLNYNEAAKGLKRIPDKREHLGRLHVYWCTNCGGFHVGHWRELPPEMAPAD